MGCDDNLQDEQTHTHTVKQDIWEIKLCVFVFELCSDTDVQDILYLGENVFSTAAFLLQGLFALFRVQLAELIFSQSKAHTALLSAQETGSTEMTLYNNGQERH